MPTQGPRSRVRRKILPLSQAVVIAPDRAPASVRPEEPRVVVVEGVVRETPPSPVRSPELGVPAPVLAAALRYERWRDELEAGGLSRGEANERILLRSEAEGGTAGADETINLTLWSERTRIPRPILEALVLSELHARRRLPAPVVRLPVVVVETADSEPWTPAPPAMRFPGPPPSSSSSQHPT
jgi:hypothetical protein